MSASPSPRTSMQLWTWQNGLRWSRARCGASVDVAGAALPLGTKDVGVQSRQRKDLVRTATLPATETAEAAHALWLHDRADLEPQQCRQLGLVEECGWTGQRATHPCPNRRCGRRRERRLRAAEDGVPERRSRAPYSGTWWGLRWSWSPTTPPGVLWTVGDGRPYQGGRLRRNRAATGRGQGGGAGSCSHHVEPHLIFNGSDNVMQV